VTGDDKVDHLEESMAQSTVGDVTQNGQQAEPAGEVSRIERR
jgi:hypothetical protein